VGIEASSVGTGPSKPISQAAYARLIGVDPSTVTRWIQNERISRLPNGLIDPERADRERAATESPMPHHQARKAQFDEEKERKAQAETAPPVSEPEPSAEGLGLALKRETWKLQKAKAETANLELDKAAGLLVERSEVEFLLRDLAAMLQSQLDGMAAKLAPSLSAHRGDVNAIQAEIESFARDLLSELAAHLERQAAQHLDRTRISA